MFEQASGEEGNIIYFSEKYVYRISQTDLKIRFSDISHIDGIVDSDLIVDQRELPESLREIKFKSAIRHTRLTFTVYPHEWSAHMLKDAALFYLNFCKELDQKKLYCVDSHPWNILYDQGRFVFVDYSSIVPLDNSKEDFYQMVSDNFTSMFFPFFLMPLLGFSYARREWIRARLFDTTINTSSNSFTFLDMLTGKWSVSRKTINLIKTIVVFYKFKCAIQKFKKNKDFIQLIDSLTQIVQRINVDLNQSDYLNYYQAKKEDFDFSLQPTWTDKQKTIHKLMLHLEGETVLDLGCNTGWFSILAARADKKVIAIDNDEASVDSLYKRSRLETLNIHPVIGSFLSFTPNRYSNMTGKRVLIDGIERFKCDIVMMLGLFHHLTLGSGLSVMDVINKLSKLTARYLILEYIDLQDDKIQNEKDFFQSWYLEKYDVEQYQLSNVLSALEQSFTVVEIYPSYPETRQIILCTKRD